MIFFAKVVPTNKRAFSNHYLIKGIILHGAESVHLAGLITTKKEICIDLALNSMFNLAGLRCCGFPSTFPVPTLPSGTQAEQRQ